MKSGGDVSSSCPKPVMAAGAVDSELALVTGGIANGKGRAIVIARGNAEIASVREIGNYAKAAVAKRSLQTLLKMAVRNRNYKRRKRNSRPLG